MIAASAFTIAACKCILQPVKRLRVQYIFGHRFTCEDPLQDPDIAEQALRHATAALSSLPAYATEGPVGHAPEHVAS